VRARLAGEGPADADLRRLLDPILAQAGEQRRVEAGPSVPDVGGALVTTTRVKGSAGEVAVHLRWKDGAIVALHRQPLAVEVPFLPDARRGGVLAGHHPFLAASPELVTVAGRSGPIALRLGSRGFRRVSL
jgi:hypothetical protein